MWWRVATNLHQNSLEGFVARKHLSPVSQFTAPAVVTGISAAHLSENKPTITRGGVNGARLPAGRAGHAETNGDDPCKEIIRVGRYNQLAEGRAE